MAEPLLRRHGVSIVIPSHDTAKLTLRCLESIRAQGEPAVQILVVDDASEDGTAEAVSARFPEARILRQTEQVGFSASLNRGLDMAEGAVLIALNSDTELLPGSLRAVLLRFGQRERLGIAGARLYYPDGTPQWSGGREPDLLWLFALASGIPPLLARVPGWRRLRPAAGIGDSPRIDWVTGAALAMRREVWERLGPSELSYLFYAQDLELCLRARGAGWDVEIVPGFQVIHHHGASIGQQARSVARQNPELLWRDLLWWARRHRGEAWAKRAALMLRLGGELRLLGRRLRGLLLPAHARRAWRHDTLVYRQALAAVSGRSTESESIQEPEARP